MSLSLIYIKSRPLESPPDIRDVCNHVHTVTFRGRLNGPHGVTLLPVTRACWGSVGRFSCRRAGQSMFLSANLTVSTRMLRRFTQLRKLYILLGAFCTWLQSVHVSASWVVSAKRFLKRHWQLALMTLCQDGRLDTISDHNCRTCIYGNSNAKLSNMLPWKDFAITGKT